MQAVRSSVQRVSVASTLVLASLIGEDIALADDGESPRIPHLRWG